MQVIHKSHMMCVTSTREKVIRQQHSKHVQHSASYHSNLGNHDVIVHQTTSREDPRDVAVAVSCDESAQSVASPVLTSEQEILSPSNEVCNNSAAVSPSAQAPVSAQHKAVMNAAALAEEANNNRNSYPDVNDSSGSDSPRDTPVEPTVDLPSVNFENLLEAKETDILNDSFHSDSSQNSQSSTHHHHHSHHHHHHHHGLQQQHPLSQSHPISNSGSQARQNHQRSLSGTCNSYAQPMPSSGSMDDILSAGQLTPRIGERHGGYLSSNMSDSLCSDSGSLTGDIQVQVEDADVNFLDADSDRTPTQEENVITKVYANTEVRLRNKKKPPMNQESAQITLGAPNQDGAYESQSQSLLQTSSQQGPISKLSPEASPIWKRKSAAVNGTLTEDVKRMSNISEASEPEGSEGRNSRSDLGGIATGSSSDNASVSSGSDQYVSVGYSRTLPPSSSTSSANSYKRESPNHVITSSTSALPKMTSRQHKRLYRIGLNLFNK